MRKALLFAILLMCCISASAQKFSFGADFDYIFLNKEFARSKNMFKESGTLHAVRLTPYVNYGIVSKPGRSLSMRLGIDLLKNAGDGIYYWDYPQEMVLYLESEQNLGKGKFSYVAGIFPRSFSEGKYSKAFFSEEDVYQDKNFEGFFVKYRKDGLYAELGLDWCGMYSEYRREAFRLMSAGTVGMFDFMSFGWAASMFHYANSWHEIGVVDNSMVNPYLGLILGDLPFFDSLSVTAGGLFTYQWDRRYDEYQRFRLGLESVQTLTKGCFSLENTFYWGDDLCPYFAKYGEGLYHGSPFYNTKTSHASAYDRLALHIEPKIGDKLRLRASFIFHFREPHFDIPAYLGTEQMLTLIYNFDRFRR